MLLNRNDYIYSQNLTLNTDFQKHIEKNLPFLLKSKVLIAVSGGIDSIALAHLLSKINCTISIAHCNFNLRENESDADCEFVAQFANKLNVSFYKTAFDTVTIAEKEGLSIQMAARKIRYDWLQEIVSKHQYNYIVTAHHLNDSLETFMINLSRGTGLDGLLGIPTIQKNIVRPLLPFTREEIENYAAKKGLKWREDKSNASVKYTRNKIRHQITPILKEINPNILESFKTTLCNLNDTKSIVLNSVEVVKKKCLAFEHGILKINIEKLRQFKNPKTYLFELLKEYGFSQWNDISNILDSQSGKVIYSNTHRIIKDRDFLIVNSIASETTLAIPISKKENTIIFPSGKITIEESNLIIEKSKNVAIIDSKLLIFPLEIRKWNKGDYFYPLGMKGSQKISDFFINQKMSILEKEKAWLLCNGNNDVIWVLEKRLDDRYKLTNTTTKALKISVHYNIIDTHEKNIFI